MYFKDMPCNTGYQQDVNYSKISCSMSYFQAKGYAEHRKEGECILVNLAM